MAFQLVLLVKNPPANSGDAKDVGSIPGWGRFPGVGNGIPLQNSCLENSRGRGARWTTVHRAIKSLTRLSDWECTLHLDRQIVNVHQVKKKYHKQNNEQNHTLRAIIISRKLRWKGHKREVCSLSLSCALNSSFPLFHPGDQWSSVYNGKS